MIDLGIHEIKYKFDSYEYIFIFNFLLMQI